MNNHTHPFIPNKVRPLITYSSPNAYAASVKKAQAERRSILGGFISWPPSKDEGTTGNKAIR